MYLNNPVIHSTRKAVLYAVSATLCWSTVAAAFKITLLHLDNNVPLMLFYASMVSCITLFIILVKQNLLETLFLIQKRHLWTSAGMGLLNPFFYYLILFKAYSILPGQEAQPLNFTWPIMLSLLSIPILKQKIRLMHGLALLMSFLGVVVISNHGKFYGLHLTSLLGVLLAIGSSVIWALYWLFQLKDKRNAVLKLFLNFCFGFVYTFVFNLVISGQIEGISWWGGLGAIWVGIFEMGLAFVLWLKALEYAPRTSSVSNVIYLCPFISLLFLHFFAGEIIRFTSVIGLFFILSGIILQQKSA